MKIEFRIPNGGGGMVQGMASAELKREVDLWEQTHGTRHIRCQTRHGYYWYIEFNCVRSLVLFLLTFRPQRDHWLRNYRIKLD